MTFLVGTVHDHLTSKEVKLVARFNFFIPAKRCKVRKANIIPAKVSRNQKANCNMICTVA